MSDNYRIICAAKEVNEPEVVADSVKKWLQDNSIIEKELSHCVLGMEDYGYKPGPKHLDAVKYDENILQLITCGVQIETGRNIFNGMEFTALTEIICPSCNRNRFEGITPQNFYTDNLTKEQSVIYQDVFPAFEKWKNHEDAKLACPHCGTTGLIDNYRIGEGIILSNVGLTFWNWPEFKQEFLNNIQDQFGTKVQLIVGRL